MNNKKKVKSFVAIIAIVLAACIVAVSSIFAWMTQSKSASKIGFQLNSISYKVKMYKGLEENYNGVPDLLGIGLGADGHGAGEKYTDDNGTTTTSSYGQYLDSDGKTWKDYDPLYYEEKYSFQLLGTKSMLSNNFIENTFEDIILEKVEPSRVYVYKFSVANENQGGYLSYSFEGYTAETSTTPTTDASAFECRMFVVINKNETISYDRCTTETTKNDGSTETNEWFDLSTEGTQLKSDVEIKQPVGKKWNYGDGSIVDIWLQIRMKSNATNNFISGNDDEDDTGATVQLPAFRIEFSTSQTTNNSSSSES